MMLPYLTALGAVWLGLRGNRRACLWLWFITLVIFIAWCKYHITDALPLSF